MKPEQAITGGEKTVKMVIEKKNLFTTHSDIFAWEENGLSSFFRPSHIYLKKTLSSKTEHVFGSLDIYKKKLVKLDLS